MTRPAISRKGFDDELVMAEATELCPLEGGLSQLRCLHIGVNRIYVDEIRSTVVRVHHSDDFSRERVDKTLRLANHLRDHDVPVVTPFSRRCVELPKSKCWATYWPLLRRDRTRCEPFVWPAPRSMASTSALGWHRG